MNFWVRVYLVIFFFNVGTDRGSIVPNTNLCSNANCIRLVVYCYWSVHINSSKGHAGQRESRKVPGMELAIVLFLKNYRWYDFLLVSILTVPNQDACSFLCESFYWGSVANCLHNYFTFRPFGVYVSQRFYCMFHRVPRWTKSLPRHDILGF